jgi:hypothetical protein
MTVTTTVNAFMKNNNPHNHPRDRYYYSSHFRDEGIQAQKWICFNQGHTAITVNHFRHPNLKESPRNTQVINICLYGNARGVTDRYKLLYRPYRIASKWVASRWLIRRRHLGSEGLRGLLGPEGNCEGLKVSVLGSVLAGVGRVLVFYCSYNNLAT